MTPHLLLKHFDRISEAPDAIPRLRRFILDLAVRGKLVEQDPRDEPASELLKRIQAQKMHMIKEGTIKGKSEPVPIVGEQPIFIPPSGWVLTTLGEVTHKITDGAHKTPTYVEEGVPFISVKDFSGGRLNFSNTRFISPEEHATLYKRCDPRCGDILIGRIGTLGKAVVVDTDNEFSLFVSVGLIRFSHDFIAPVFFRLLLNSPFVESEFDRIKIGGGTHTNKLNLGDLHTILLSLPPLAEQHRIVAKVNELMALCDRLEAAQTERENRRDRLVASSLDRLNNGSDTFQGHARFYFNHLPRLTTRTAHIKQLRQTILNLAVRGKLVPQDPTDEPASELLKRTQAEKTRLMAEGTVTRQKLTGSERKNLGFDSPMTWQAVNLADVCNLVTSGSRGWAEFYSNSGAKFIRAQNIRFGKLRLDDLAYVNLPRKAEGTRTQISKGDLLIVITGAGVTNPALLDHELGEAYVSQHVALIKPTAISLSPWLLLCLMAPHGARDELVQRAYGAGKPGLNLDNIRFLRIPLPPLAEQHRIVAKVNELMAICDQLETRLTTTQSESQKLMEAILDKTLSVKAQTKGSNSYSAGMMSEKSSQMDDNKGTSRRILQ